MGVGATTLIGEKRHSGQQLMGETREPMAADCWRDANRIAEKYAETFKSDFYVMFAAKPDAQLKHAIRCGWEVVIKRPPVGIVGALVFKWSHKDQQLTPDTDLCLPNDVPISEFEMSRDPKDCIPTVFNAARKSGSIFLA
jgi:hypothetical protein